MACACKDKEIKWRKAVGSENGHEKKTLTSLFKGITSSFAMKIITFAVLLAATPIIIAVIGMGLFSSAFGVNYIFKTIKKIARKISGRQSN